jgi:hypothetical protein
MKLLSILALAVLGLSARPDDTTPELVPVPLGEVCEHPLDYLGQGLSVVFQVQSLPTTWNPYVTRFSNASHNALSVWGDEQLLWLAAEYDRPLSLVFARRGTTAARFCAEAKPYDRFAAVVHVRQVFLGRPWIEIERIQPLERKITEGSVLHAARALTLMANKEWSLARADVDRARVGELPEHVSRALDELARECDLRLEALRPR